MNTRIISVVNQAMQLIEDVWIWVWMVLCYTTASTLFQDERGPASVFHKEEIRQYVEN